MIPADLLAAEAGIVARLKEATQTGPDAWCRLIATRMEAATVQEEQQVTPALYVLWDGAPVSGSTEYSATLAHRWMVLLALAAPAGGRSAAPLRGVAGPHLSSVLTALLGQTPPGCTQPLKLASVPRPWSSDAKFSYFPLVFTTDAVLCPANL